MTVHYQLSSVTLNGAPFPLPPSFNATIGGRSSRWQLGDRSGSLAPPNNLICHRDGSLTLVAGRDTYRMELVPVAS